MHWQIADGVHDDAALFPTIATTREDAAMYLQYQ
jgi:hypothetical protein